MPTRFRLVTTLFARKRVRERDTARCRSSSTSRRCVAPRRLLDAWPRPQPHRQQRHGTPYTPLRISYAWVFSPARCTNPPLSRLSHLPQSSRSLRRMRLTAAASSSGKAPWRLLVLPPVLPVAANRGPFCAASHGSPSHAPKVRREPKLPAPHTAAEARARFTQPRKGALRRQVHLGG